MIIYDRATAKGRLVLVVGAIVPSLAVTLSQAGCCGSSCHFESGLLNNW